MRKTRAERKEKVQDKKKRVFAILCQAECVACGESDPLVLEFDHIAEDKRADISSLIQSDCSWDHLRKELNRCQVLCSNCHKRKTHMLSNSYRYQFLSLRKTG